MVFFKTILCFSQNYQDVVKEDIEDDSTINSILSSENVEKAALEIVAQIGLPQNFVLKASDSKEFKNNAVAKMKRDENDRNQRYVIYDPNFFIEINRKANNDWAAISILAHEIGHHLNNHPLNNDGSSFEYEFLADEWSGFVLRKMGANLKDAQSAIATLKDPKVPSKTHPPKAERLASIEKGWRKGQKTLDKFTEEDEITAEMIKHKYIDAIGGRAITSNISSMKYLEQMKPEFELEDVDQNNNFVDVISGFGTYQYYFVGKNFIKESLNDGTKYMSKNGESYFKKKSRNKDSDWTSGYHPYMNNIYHDLRETDITPNIEPALGSIYDEILVNQNDSTTFKGITTKNGIPSYELESKWKKNIRKSNNTAIEITTLKKRYYNVQDGLLHFVLEVKKEFERRKNKVKYEGTITTETIIEDYSMENDFLIPHKFLVNTVFVKDGRQEQKVSHVRTISKFELNFNIDEPFLNSEK